MLPTNSNPSQPHARAVARLVNPLVADTLALRRRVEQCGADAPGASAVFAVFADQLRASADLMAECVRAAGAAAQARRADARARGGVAGRDLVHPPAAGTRGDALRRLFADEDEVAGRLRRAIAECDDRDDDRTADRIEEVLEEIEWQRGVLRDLLRGTPTGEIATCAGSRSAPLVTPRAASPHAAPPAAG